MIIRSTRVIFPFHSCFPLVPHLLKKMGKKVVKKKAKKKKRKHI